MMQIEPRPWLKPGAKQVKNVARVQARRSFRPTIIDDPARRFKRGGDCALRRHHASGFGPTLVGSTSGGLLGIRRRPNRGSDLGPSHRTMSDRLVAATRSRQTPTAERERVFLSSPTSAAI